MSALAGLISPFIPILVRLIGVWVTKKFVDDPEALKRFRLFIDSVRTDLPVSLYQQHHEHIRDLRREMLGDDEEKRIMKANMDNYQASYEKAYQDKLDAEEKFRSVYSDNQRLEDEILKVRNERAIKDN